MRGDAAVTSEHVVTATRPARRTSPSAPLPLSAAQARLWELGPDSPAHHELVTIHPTGPLDIDALRGALTELVARHQVLRTTFSTIDGVPHQIVREPAGVDLPVVDFTHVSREDAARRVDDIAAADTRRPWSLTAGPLFRPRLIRVTADDHRLQLSVHTLISDQTTLRRTVLPELAALYRSHATAARSSLTDPPAQYADYTAWEFEWLRGPQVAGRIDRWRGTLAGSTLSQLPLDHPRPSRPTFTGGTIPLTIEPATVAKLRGAAQSAGGTLDHALAAAYAWWLHLYADSTDVVFGSALDLREAAERPDVAGNCATPVVLRCDVSGEEPFTALVGRIRQVVWQAARDAVPVDTLAAGLGFQRDPRNSALFTTRLLCPSPAAPPADGWSLHPMHADVRDAVGSATFDVSIEVDERPDGSVAGGLVFSADVLERATAHQMASHWCSLLDAVAAEPEIPLAAHDLVDAEERRRQLSWNRTADDLMSPHCVHELVSAQVEATPAAVAVQVGDATLTYRQLDDRATAIAMSLLQAGAGPGSVVALLLDRTPDVVAAILGVLKTGAAFLPLDPRQPIARNSFCINDVGAHIVLTDRDLTTGADAIAAAVVDIGDVGPAAPARRALPSTVSSEDLAYVICTSGSTGRPKPVLVEHRGVTNLTRTLSREFGIEACDTVLSVASISFDMALFDIFCALVRGARVLLATAEQAMNPAALSRLIAASGATYMFATPTTWAALIAAGWQGDRRLRAAAGGETLTDSLAQALLQRCGAVWNGYGPTETTGGTNIVRLAPGDAVTVGRPLPNVRVYVVDTQGRLQPVGVPGEIAIGGVGVGRGYLNRPEENARRFRDDPFHAGGRLYLTGDRGRLLPDGRLQHLGRFDDQLKIRGFRIEPGEIESTLCEHPEVAGCAVVAREGLTGEQQLVAYVVGEPGRPSDAEIRTWLRDRLPEYMVPRAFVHVSGLPMTANGKLDKAALPAPSSPAGDRVDAQPPRTDTEKRVAALWADLLGTPVTDISSDFFDLGGHSLLAARLISEVEQTFGVELSLASFIDSGRIVAKLAELLSAESPRQTCDVTSNPPLHFIFSDSATAMSVRHFTAQWGPAQPIHALAPEQPGGRFDRSVSVEEHARQALSTILRRQPEGPLALAGFSIGGLVAYEVARQALDAGRQIAWLGIVDAVAPPMHELQRTKLTLRWRLRSTRRLPLRQRWAKYIEVGLRALRNCRPRPGRVFDHHGVADIACRYRQPGHRVAMELFVSERSAAGEGGDLLGWNGFHQGPLSGHRLAGDHVGLLQLPVANLLARSMLESLRASRGRRSAAMRLRPEARSQHRPSAANRVGLAGPA